jgi:hypothetical protein
MEAIEYVVPSELFDDIVAMTQPIHGDLLVHPALASAANRGRRLGVSRVVLIEHEAHQDTGRRLVVDLATS